MSDTQISAYISEATKQQVERYAEAHGVKKGFLFEEALRLARLAVDERARGRGVGTSLLRSVLVLAQGLAVNVGCLGLGVDAKPDAIAFYEKLGFITLEVEAGHLGDRPEPLPMFLELGQLTKEA